MPEILYEPHSKAQDQFHESVKPKVLLTAGYGYGKTYALVMKMFKLMDINRGCPGGMICPTLKMYKKDVLPTIREVCARDGIKYKYNASDSVWFFPATGSTLYIFHGEDGGKSIRGPNLAFMLMNEVNLLDFDTFNAAIARVRLKKARLLQTAMSGTPEGFNWCYEYFIENPREDTDIFYGDTRENIHIAESYVTMLENSYDELMQEQFVRGKFVNLRGKRAVYAFDRRRHTSDQIEKIDDYPVWVSLDFNVSPMAAVLWNRVPFGANYYGGPEFLHELRAFDEICIESSNTYELCEVLRDRLGGVKDVTIYPDPAGAARSTKTKNISDIDILRDFGFTDIKYKTKLSVRNCINATNKMFQRDMVVLNSKKCRNAIADLEQCIFKENTFELDKTNPKRTHWLDGIKNMIDYEFPIQAVRGMWTQRIR